MLTLIQTAAYHGLCHHVWIWKKEKRSLEKRNSKHDKNLQGERGSLLWKWSSWGATTMYVNRLTCGARRRWKISHLWQRCLSTVRLFVLHNEMKTRGMKDRSPSTYWFICLSIMCNISEDADWITIKSFWHSNQYYWCCRRQLQVKIWGHIWPELRLFIEMLLLCCA